MDPTAPLFFSSPTLAEKKKKRGKKSVAQVYLPSIFAPFVSPPGSNIGNSKTRGKLKPLPITFLEEIVSLLLIPGTMVKPGTLVSASELTAPSNNIDKWSTHWKAKSPTEIGK